jgi:hypothetical protein
VYHLDDPPLPKNPDLKQVRLLVGELRGCQDAAQQKGREPAKDSLRAKYVRQVRELEDKQKTKDLTVKERVNLSACYVRLGRYQQAVQLLEETRRGLKEDEPWRFLVLANLAAAYEGEGQFPDRALDAEREALRVWPLKVEGWDQARWHGYRRAERFHWTLMQLRRREQLLSRGKPVLFTTADPLFGTEVRFAGPGGKYQAGPLPLTLADLPPDAAAIGLQLVLWLPLDNRLYWLYGELLNAQGQVREGYAILDELASNARNMSGVPELMAHRKVLFTARDAVAPDRPEEPAEEKPAPAPAASATWLPDWRPLVVGFASGAVVAVVLALQWQEWRRRRAARGPALDWPEPRQVADGTRAGGGDDRITRAGP